MKMCKNSICVKDDFSKQHCEIVAAAAGNEAVDGGNSSSTLFIRGQ
jgi:hypothetical protein